MKLRTFFALVCVLAVAVNINASQKMEKKYKDQYRNIEVSNFDVKEGVEFPEQYKTILMGEVVAQFQQNKKFKQVSREGETSSSSSEPTVRLTGTVTKFQAGSRTKRYLVGFGAGKTKIVAHVKFIDRATGNVLFEDDVDGKVIMGFIGGESEGAARGLAKEVAKVANKLFF